MHHRISQDERLVDFVAAVLVDVENLVVVAALGPAQHLDVAVDVAGVAVASVAAAVADVVIVVVDVAGAAVASVAVACVALLQALQSKFIGRVLSVATGENNHVDDENRVKFRSENLHCVPEICFRFLQKNTRGCGSVGRAVAFVTRDLRFESLHWQNVINQFKKLEITHTHKLTIKVSI